MRCQWIMSILSILVSMGVLVIIMGQYQVMTMLNNGNERLQVKSQKLYDQLTSEDLFKATMEKLLVQGKKAVDDLEAQVAKLGPEVEKKKTQNDACQAEKKTKTDELAATEKARADTEASLKSESDAWIRETDTLKAQLTAYSPICNHVKKGALAEKLCGSPTTLAPLVTKINS